MMFVVIIVGLGLASTCCLFATAKNTAGWARAVRIIGLFFGLVMATIIGIELASPFM